MRESRAGAIFDPEMAWKRALPVNKKNSRCLREQLDVRRKLWKEDVLVNTTLKDISKKADMLAAILAADQRYYSAAVSAFDGVFELGSNGPTWLVHRSTIMPQNPLKISSVLLDRPSLLSWVLSGFLPKRLDEVVATYGTGLEICRWSHSVFVDSTSYKVGKGRKTFDSAGRREAGITGNRSRFIVLPGCLNREGDDVSFFWKKSAVQTITESSLGITERIQEFGYHLSTVEEKLSSAHIAEHQSSVEPWEKNTQRRRPLENELMRLFWLGDSERMIRGGIQIAKQAAIRNIDVRYKESSIPGVISYAAHSRVAKVSLIRSETRERLDLRKRTDAEQAHKDEAAERRKSSRIQQLRDATDSKKVVEVEVIVCKVKCKSFLGNASSFACHTRSMYPSGLLCEHFVICTLPPGVRDTQLEVVPTSARSYTLVSGPDDSLLNVLTAPDGHIIPGQVAREALSGPVRFWSGRVRFPLPSKKKIFNCHSKREQDVVPTS
ncbi:hypothetical protein C8R43DRAFT_1111920 [Mycena crocata]|nr:hypothetical protein C8R43DRAFT_1111920 [Mycena crocata]